jgi:hypothetical protein
MSKNAVTIEQLNIACRHVIELMDAGITENLAIRTLELFTNTYAKMRVVGKANVDHASQYELWSKAARQAKLAYPKKAYGKYLRVEHGTPRRQFARLVLDAFKKKKLTQRWMNNLCNKRWQVAVITIEEDRRLTKISRSALFPTASGRWEAARIKF